MVGAIRTMLGVADVPALVAGWHVLDLEREIWTPGAVGFPRIFVSAERVDREARESSSRSPDRSARARCPRSRRASSRATTRSAKSRSERDDGIRSRPRRARSDAATGAAAASPARRRTRPRRCGARPDGRGDRRGRAQRPPRSASRRARAQPLRDGARAACRRRGPRSIRGRFRTGRRNGRFRAGRGRSAALARATRCRRRRGGRREIGAQDGNGDAPFESASSADAGAEPRATQASPRRRVRRRRLPRRELRDREALAPRPSATSSSRRARGRRWPRARKSPSATRRRAGRGLARRRRQRAAVLVRDDPDSILAGAGAGARPTHDRVVPRRPAGSPDGFLQGPGDRHRRQRRRAGGRLQRPARAQEVLDTAELFRGRLQWFDHHEWPIEDLVRLRAALGRETRSWSRRTPRARSPRSPR